MKNIKKLKSYGKAVAGSALLVGATLTGAAGLAAAQSGSSGQATLHDYPTPFVDDEGNVDTSIVVGTDGKQADVVSALDIAGDLGNSAFTTESVSGSAGAVDGEAFDEVTVGTALGQTSIDASDYSGFVRKTVEDDDGNDVFVTESASITNDVKSRINGTTTDLEVTSTGAVSYTATYSPGFQVNDTVTFLGNEYELVDVQDNGDTLKLGSSMSTDVTVGDSYTHGPYTVEVVGKTSGDNPEPVVRISKGEETLDRKALSEGEELEVDNEDFSVSAETVIFYEDGSTDITLESTYTDTTLEEGEELPMDSNYKVANSVAGSSNGGINAEATGSNDKPVLKGITVKSEATTKEDPEGDDEVNYVETGQSFAGPNDYFSVTNQGLSDETMTDVEFGTDLEVTFTDTNNQEHSVDLNNFVKSAVDINTEADQATASTTVNEGGYFAVTGSSGDTSYLVEVTDVSTDGSGNVDAVTLKHNEFEKEFTSTGTVSTGYGFNVGISEFSSGDAEIAAGGSTQAYFTTQNGAEVSYKTSTSYDKVGTGNSDPAKAGGPATDFVTVNESTGAESSAATALTVAYEDGDDHFTNSDDGEIAEMKVGNATVDGASGLTDVDDGDSTLSPFGSGLELSSASSATVMYPDEQRHQLAAFGAVGEGTGDAVSYQPTGFPAGTGTLDSEVSNSERDQNMILVGGPEVNSLTADLASAGETWNSTQYENNQGVGVLDLVNDAFSDGYSALVVAGWNAEDTSAAADYLVNYNSETDTALQGKTTAQVNTDTGELVQ